MVWCVGSVRVCTVVCIHVVCGRILCGCVVWCVWCDVWGGE